MSDAPDAPTERPIELHRLVRPMLKDLILRARQPAPEPILSDEEAEYLIRAAGLGED